MAEFHLHLKETTFFIYLCVAFTSLEYTNDSCIYTVTAELKYCFLIKCIYYMISLVIKSQYNLCGIMLVSASSMQVSIFSQH